MFEKKTNPHLIILKGALPKNIDLSKARVYHIKSFEYTDSNMALFDKNIDDENFYKILENLQYNSQANNVSVYYVVKSDGQSEVYLVSDPLELYEKEYVMKKYQGSLNERVMNLSTVEQIN